MKRQSPSYSLTVRLRYPDKAGQLGRITSAIGETEGMIGSVDIVEVRKDVIIRDITFNARDVEHGEHIVERLHSMPGVEVLRVSDRTYRLHLGGKIEVQAKIPIKNRDDLSMVYTPGVARVCRSIYNDPDAAFTLTIRRNMVAVVTDGTAVLGLGDIGPRAALPVMEGKAMLFKEFGGVDAFPICLDTKDTEKIIETVAFLAPTFGGINLEDISSPRCVEIEERLTERLDIPVFHDDQHGTAIVVLAALENALKVVRKEMKDIRVVVCGAGAAGQAIVRLLQAVGVGPIVVCDRQGALNKARNTADNPVKQWLIAHTNPEQVAGTIGAAMQGADAFIGVASANLITVEDIKRMAPQPIVFALANPDPEIDPDLAASCAAVVASGRSDYANQINNVLCFPGLFRGMFDVRARRVAQEMKIAAARAIAGVIEPKELTADYIIPSVFDRRVAPAVAKAVAKAAHESGVAHREHKPGFKISP
ncbi:MAG: NAD-dependent malic enzyme [Pirellulales bacterium]|nr:NAD-dependent malic enzyme [Pirellulales bacterium]